MNKKAYQIGQILALTKAAGIGEDLGNFWGSLQAKGTNALNAIGTPIIKTEQAWNRLRRKNPNQNILQSAAQAGVDFSKNTVAPYLKTQWDDFNAANNRAYTQGTGQGPKIPLRSRDWGPTKVNLPQYKPTQGSGRLRPGL